MEQKDSPIDGGPQSSIQVSKIIPARDPKQCVKSISRKLRDLDALGSREVMVVIKLGIVVTVAVVGE